MASPTSPKIRVADVVLDVRTGGASALYTYSASPEFGIGDAVFVPLGARRVLGYVVATREVEAENLGYPLEKLKSISGRLENVGLPHPVVELIQFACAEYICPVPVALSAATPPGILERVVTAWALTGGVSHAGLTVVQRETLKAIESQGGTIEQSSRKKLEPKVVKALRLLEGKGLLRSSLRFSEFRTRTVETALWTLSPDSALVQTYSERFGKKRPAQALTILSFQENPDAALTIGDIKATCGVTEAVVKQLIEAKILVKVDPETVGKAKPPSPNPHQSLAIDAIAECVRSCETRTFLLFGVTGSGKTEVFLRAATEALRCGRTVLYLVPEIALATQSVKLLRERFGSAVSLLHSDLAPGERLENWMSIRKGDAAVVLGARSAVFAPLENIGLIVMDEEHEQSYKQESAPRYHTRRLAEFLAKIHSCPLVLGSATPSVESFWEAEQERITLLTLPTRAASAKLPLVHVVDLTLGYKSGVPSLFTEDLSARLRMTLDRGEQSILFLNRRAYAPFLLCRDCGRQFPCPNCAVMLTYSRRQLKLRCHHCGHSENPPDICPRCEGTRLSPLGVGTEKVEDAVANLMPNARVARLDRDAVQRRGELERILAGFGSGEIDVLVGTQMVAKGLNFPNVTLVGVVAADMSLGIPDFRAAERTFQLLSQVAGRAGRGQRPGEVVIQTFNPGHPAILAAQAHQYVEFYESQREERHDSGYPPFVRMVNLVFTGDSRTETWDLAHQVADDLRLFPSKWGLLGPTSCPLERLNNRWRVHILLKLPPGAIPSDLAEIVGRLKHGSVSVVIDVDPFSLS